ncbi:hypothetical protein [Heyndrickxia ginsengihumi]|uniref:hypothetical protein n=1 Tax=Heyndrickxia ginsengihumi TaxID=363870 RepID=UPI003D217C22
MKKILFSLMVMITCAFISVASVEASPEPEIKGQPHHRLIIKQSELDALLKKGYSKHDIFHALFIYEHSKQKTTLENILQYHKQHPSWKETAKHFGVDIEKIKKEHREARNRFYATHKDKIINYLATYNHTSKQTIQKYVSKNEDLHFLIFASAIAKVSNKNLDQIMRLHQEGKSPHEIVKQLKIDRGKLFKEIRTIHDGIQEQK